MGPSYGGPFQSVRKLAQSQLAAGLKPEVRMPWSAEAVEHLNDWSPVPVNIGGKIWLSPLGWSPGYGEELLACDADILHTHGLWLHPSWVALGWKRKWQRPHVVSVRGMLEPWAWRHNSWKKRPVWWFWEKRNLLSASLLHATSDQEAQALRSRGLTLPIAIIPNGVEMPDSARESLAGHQISCDSPSGLSRDSAINAGVKPQDAIRTALFLGRLHPIKGLPMLLEAWAKVRPASWSLEIAGPDEGGHRAELERLVRSLNLTQQVRFSGHLMESAKHEAFRRASLFLLPTHSENFGIAVAEALAHGLPVITTHGAPWKLLELESCGWWVPINVEGIAAALDNATRRSPDDLAAMGALGRTVVEKRFAWHGIARQFEECYAWLLGKGAKPACVVD